MKRTTTFAIMATLTTAVAVASLWGLTLTRRAVAAEPPHFHSSAREVIVEDRTGNGAWSAAITHAVEAWNQAGVVHLTHVTGAGDCESVVPGRLLFCERPLATLEGGQGVGYAYPDGSGHIYAGRAWGCSDCASDARKRVIATHEIGHLLGLGHRADRTSVMCDRGCREAPNQADLDTLRALHNHEDPAPATAAPASLPDVVDGLLPRLECALACI